jgi:WD40 repeat protein
MELSGKVIASRCAVLRAAEDGVVSTPAVPTTTVAMDTPHAASITSVSVTHGSGDNGAVFAVSGSADERVTLYSLSSRHMHGQLPPIHGGTINSLYLTESGTLISASGDGVVRVQEGKIERTGGAGGAEATKRKRSEPGAQSRLNFTGTLAELAPPKVRLRTPVLSLSVHPTERVALSLSQPNRLRLADLVVGRTVYEEKVRFLGRAERAEDGTWGPGTLGSSSGNLHTVAWSASGLYYALVAGGRVLMRDTSNLKLWDAYLDERRDIRALTFGYLDEEKKIEVAIAGIDDGNIVVTDVETGKETATLAPAHPTRVKALAVMSAAPWILISASSDGTVRVWDLVCGGLVAETKFNDTRLTCMDVH